MDDDALRARAAERLARSELNRIEETRDIAHLLQQGRDTSDILSLLRVDPGTVRRVENLLDLRDFDEERVEEIIVRAVVRHTDRRELVERLKATRYAFGDTSPHPFEGAMSCSWDAVRDAFFEGWLTRAEYAAIRAAVTPEHDGSRHPGWKDRRPGR